MSAHIVNIINRTMESFILRNRPPVELRDKVDLGYSNQKNVIEIFEIRPIWSMPSETQQLPFAKIKYIKSRKIWKLYWMRASGKWQSYGPSPEYSNLEEALDEIDKDPFGCFKG